MAVTKWDASRRLNIYLARPEDRERFNADAKRAGLENDRGAFLMQLLDDFEIKVAGDRSYDAAVRDSQAHSTR